MTEEGGHPVVEPSVTGCICTNAQILIICNKTYLRSLFCNLVIESLLFVFLHGSDLKPDSYY